MRDYSVLNGMIENQKSELRTAYDKGYNQGVKDTDFQLAISKRQDEAYKQGLHDAWECMKKICRIIPVDDFAKVFGDERVKNLCDIITYISPFEAIEKVKEYDEKTFDVPDNCKIEVGDEIVSGDAHVVVTWLDKYGNWNGMLLNECEEGHIGCTYSCMSSFRGWRKTNKRYPKIAEALGKKDDTDA